MGGSIEYFKIQNPGGGGDREPGMDCTPPFLFRV